MKVSEPAVHAYVLGEHGDSQFVAWSTAQVAGTPLLNFPQLNQQVLDEMADYARNKAYKIINCKGNRNFEIFENSKNS